MAHAEPGSRPPLASVGASPPHDSTAAVNGLSAGWGAALGVTWVKPFLLLVTKKAGKQRRRPYKPETGRAGSLPTPSVAAVHTSK